MPDLTINGVFTDLGSKSGMPELVAALKRLYEFSQARAKGTGRPIDERVGAVKKACEKYLEDTGAIRPLADEENRTLVNAALLYIAMTQDNHRIVLPTAAILDVAQKCPGGLAIAISPDDRPLTITAQARVQG